MATANPSRKKFRTAKLFAKALYKEYGDKLKAVFVVGSVGSNIALPSSDIDVVVVVNSEQMITKADHPEIKKIAENVGEMKKEKVHVFGIRLNDLLSTRRDPAEEILLRAVPVFGSARFIKWCKDKKVFCYPNRAKIQTVYGEYQRKDTFKQRLAYKKQMSKRRFK